MLPELTVTVQREMADERPSAALYAKRPDLPMANPPDL